jgi:hypothetical protein
VLCYSGNTTLKQCSILANYSDTRGSGVSVWFGTAHLYNCLVANNSAPDFDLNAGISIVRNSYAVVDVVNCTVVANSPRGIANGFWSTCGVTNSILYFNNSGGAQIRSESTLWVEYSDIQNGWPGTTNISANPGLSPANLSLLPGSPCIDTGNPNPAYNDVCLAPCGLSQGSVTNDMGAYGGPGACGWTSPCVPSITTQPTDQNGCVGHSGTFTVLAAGTPPLSYQWYFNTNTPFLNRTNASLTLTSLQGTNVGKYSVVVSNPYGSVTSALAQLTLYDPYIELEVEWYFDEYWGAGLNIAGQPGATYELRYTTDPRNTNWATWTPLPTHTMGPSGWWFYLDEDSPSSPMRFYQARRKP